MTTGNQKQVILSQQKNSFPKILTIKTLSLIGNLDAVNPKARICPAKAKHHQTDGVPLYNSSPVNFWHVFSSH